ncbi:hypothetical protein Q4485_16675 [Granulosicoccaceae sp. 1_MG-2023]|nr:hypothetical protein [Granulosicoccaceae sp. 1_MG-2023]
MHEDTYEADWLDQAENKIAELIGAQFYYSRVHPGTGTLPGQAPPGFEAVILPPGMSHFSFHSWCTDTGL